MSTTTETPVRQGSGAMFDRIATRYDLLNRIVSLGLDQRWRERLVAEVGRDQPAGGEVLDLATGTADVALRAAARRPDAPVLGVDPSANMLEIGRAKIAAEGLEARVRLELGDAQALPFADGRFRMITMAFGIRNVVDRPRALAEMFRVLAPGGAVGILELNQPQRGLLAQAARIHIHQVVPRVGAWLSGDQEYAYLARSIAAFPPPEEFAALVRAAGFVDVRAEPLTFGAVCLFTGRKPA
jgi:demethylmenaquinone methyltransferase/2-methoxy-6-polyprenyl-1,4-benzoquinol methylase